MNKTWMPITAGILDIISGIVQFTVFSYIVGSTIYIFATTVGMDVGKGMLRMYSFLVSPLSVTAILAILGGIYVIKKKRWNLVYLGAVSACLPLGLFIFVSIASKNLAWSLIMLIGIAALILSLRAEKEFKK